MYWLCVVTCGQQALVLISCEAERSSLSEISLNPKWHSSETWLGLPANTRYTPYLAVSTLMSLQAVIYGCYCAARRPRANAAASTTVLWGVYGLRRCVCGTTRTDRRTGHNVRPRSAEPGTNSVRCPPVVTLTYTDYDHVPSHLPQTFKVSGSKIKVIAWHDVLEWKKLLHFMNG